MSICIICREHPAEVPDRNSQSLRPVKRVCRACHAARLRSDLKHIVAENSPQRQPFNFIGGKKP